MFLVQNMGVTDPASQCPINKYLKDRVAFNTNDSGTFIKFRNCEFRPTLFFSGSQS